MTDKPAPRVLRRDTAEAVNQGSRVVRDEEVGSEMFQGTLSNGRLVQMREMTAGDLLFLEKSLANAGDMERSLKLAARLTCGEGRMTYDDLQKLKVRDLKVVTTLLTDAGATDDEEDEYIDEDNFPN